MTQPIDLTYTPDQATDLAKYFLGPEWFAWSMNGACILGVPLDGARHANTSWRDVFRMAGVKLPVRTRGIFVGVGREVMNGGEWVAAAGSATMAARIANALNWYKPGKRGH
jgi:hypothetical protein